jgi:hypothetical protein
LLGVTLLRKPIYAKPIALKLAAWPQKLPAKSN